jgi:nuclear transport factor 2 (NTF2) superfamily protein
VFYLKGGKERYLVLGTAKSYHQANAEILMIDEMIGRRNQRRNPMTDQKAPVRESQEKKETMTRPPLPPFTRETAIQKVRAAEDGWNSRDPEKVALAYTIDSRWRNRAEFPTGRSEIVQFLKRKWAKELDYRLIKELWAHNENRIAVRFAYEWHDDSGNWFRSYGNENWEFDNNGLMRLRFASINDLPIKESERKYHWPLGRRPDDHPGLSDLGL